MGLLLWRWSIYFDIPRDWCAPALPMHLPRPPSPPPPVSAHVLSFASLLSVAHRAPLGAARAALPRLTHSDGSYEAYALYQFFTLLVAFLDGERRMVRCAPYRYSTTYQFIIYIISQGICAP